jgi:hypothetical protein
MLDSEWFSKCRSLSSVAFESASRSSWMVTSQLGGIGFVEKVILALCEILSEE